MTDPLCPGTNQTTGTPYWVTPDGTTVNLTLYSPGVYPNLILKQTTGTPALVGYSSPGFSTPLAVGDFAGWPQASFTETPPASAVPVATPVVEAPATYGYYPGFNPP